MGYFEPPEGHNTLGVDGEIVHLPHQFTELRPHQLSAIREVRDRFRDGYRVVFLDAPTGAGKTIIGEAVRQIIAARRKSLYVCTTRTLQDQFLRDFPDAKLIKGRANYPTADHPDDFYLTGPRQLTCADCSMMGVPFAKLPVCDGCDPWDEGLDILESEKRVPHCDHCHPVDACPYRAAKEAALAGPLTVANTAYYLTEANMVGTFGERRWTPKGTDQEVRQVQFPFQVIDEGDTLESVLMSQVEMVVGRRTMKTLGLTVPDKVTKPDSWIEWTEYAHGVAHERWRKLNQEARPWYAEDRSPPTELQRKIERAHQTRKSIERTRAHLIEAPDNWILDGYQQGHVILRPIEIDRYAPSYLWRHGDQFLLMSATWVSPAQAASDLGLEPGEWAEVRVDSQFPVDRRKVIVKPRASMSQKNRDTEWPKLVEALHDILELHQGERVLVHTVSYELAKYLHGELGSTSHGHRVMTYSNAEEREKRLEAFRVTEGAVMLAPSLDRGVDLPDEDVRVIVIAKVPFPNLGDKQVQQRLYGTGLRGKTWYSTQTIRAMVQMTGRGMRHKDDWCVSYILDRQFLSNVWRSNRHLVPKWWADALEWRV